MVVLIDTNVILDFLITREPFYRASLEILRKCAMKELTGCIAFHSIPNLWYILRKTPENKRREWMSDICSFLEVVGANHKEVVNAIQNKNFKDFEDCLQDKCAITAGAEYIITRNPLDFEYSQIPAIQPEDFLERFESKN